jgi:MFS family permease
MWQAIAHLFESRSFKHLMIAVGILWFSNVGAGQWHVPFLQRSHGLDLKEVGFLLSFLSIPSLIAVLGGGFLADRLAKRNPTWQIYVPLLGTLISIPFLLGFYLAPTWQLAFASACLAMLSSGVFAGVLLAAVQGLVGPHARALAGAILMFSSNLIGVGLGRFAVGVLSDLLMPIFAQDSLRWALVIMKVLPFWAVFHMWLASKSFIGDLREAPSQADPVS